MKYMRKKNKLKRCNLTAKGPITSEDAWPEAVRERLVDKSAISLDWNEGWIVERNDRTAEREYFAYWVALGNEQSFERRELLIETEVAKSAGRAAKTEHLLSA